MAHVTYRYITIETDMNIYLDYAAATPVNEQVLAAMMPYFAEQFYNPSSSYRASRAVRQAVEEARAQVAHWLGAKSAEIIFTAGATEAINLVVHGVAAQFPHSRILVAATDHIATQQAARRTDCSGLIPVLPNGLIDLAALEAAIDDTTVLVSIDYANSEIGTIQPLAAIAKIITNIKINRQKNGNMLPLYFHTDASQAAGHMDLHVHQLGVDMLTINAGKIYGPKQMGALYIATGIELAPLFGGGGQERGLRSGTENVPGIVGLAMAFDLAQHNRRENNIRLMTLRNELQQQLLGIRPDGVVNGHPKNRLPNLLHISWPGMDAERLLLALDEQGIQVATGAACAANKQMASHVLVAIGLDEATRQGSLRFSLGAHSTPQHIAQVVQAMGHLLQTSPSGLNS